jgi:hypothetical protein
MKERVWRWSGCDLLFAWVLYKYFIEGERWSNKEVERERERMTCVLFLELDISENMAGSG